MISKRSLLRTILILLAFAITAAAVLPARASGGYSAAYNAVLDRLESGPAPEFGSVGGEWKVLALARSGRVSPASAYAAAYYSRIEAMVRANGSNILDSNRSTENSRLIIALSSIGRDARDVAGYDLTAPLSDLTFVKRQGVNGAIFALIALDCNSAYGMASAKQACIDFILSREISGGGWALAGTNPDPDVTAMAVTALSRHSSASAAVDRGVAVLSRIQSEDGGFVSYGSASSESCSQVLLALASCGINGASDSRFVKSGGSVLDALLRFFTGGGFAHSPGGDVNALASEQAAYALCGYDRLMHGRNTLYNMNDVSFVSPTPTPGPTPTPTPRPTPTPTPKPTATPTPKPTEAPTPTPKPTAAPTAAPTDAPTNAPTEAATEAPTEAAETEPPAEEPTEAPTAPVTPFEEPTAAAEPTEAPSQAPAPTPLPTPYPTTDGDGMYHRPNRTPYYIAGGALLLAAAAAAVLIVRRRK